MSLRETILESFKDYGVYNLKIDKDSSEHGVPATDIRIFMNNPKGYNTGRLMLHWTFAKGLGIDAKHITRLMKRQADRDIKEFVK